MKLPIKLYWVNELLNRKVQPKLQLCFEFNVDLGLFDLEIKECSNTMKIGKSIRIMDANVAKLNYQQLAPTIVYIIGRGPTYQALHINDAYVGRYPAKKYYYEVGWTYSDKLMFSLLGARTRAYKNYPYSFGIDSTSWTYLESTLVDKV